MVLKYKDMHAFDNYKTMKIIYSIYRAGEVSVRRLQTNENYLQYLQSW